MKKRNFTFLTWAPLRPILTILAFAIFIFNPTFAQQQAFVSSNTSGQIGIIDGNTTSTFDSQGTDADGIFYDKNKDVLYQLNRTDDVINIYTNVADALSNGTNPTLVATSTSDFANGREIAVSGNKLVVADDASMDNNMTNRLVIYTLGADNSITLEKKHPVNFALWGIHLDGSTLYAIQDVSPNLAVFYDFFSTPDGDANPDQVIYVEGIVRTHGLTYDSNSDVMVLTDIGAASSADDGFLVVVPDFSTKISDNVLSNSDQLRIGGATSMLGNPVDVALDTDNEVIYVAERAVTGGMILGFNYPTMTGDATPFYSNEFAGASGINLPASQNGPCGNIDGGLVELADGGTSTTITIDGNADVISFSSSVPTSSDYEFTYVVTNSSGFILGIPPGNSNDFDPAGVGTCYVYGLTYTGNLNIAMGDDLLANGLAISSDCADLSSNFLTINRIMEQNPIAGTQIFVSSNTSGQIGIIEGDMMNMFDSQGADADGIYYDQNADILYQLNRTDDVINVYTGVNAALANGTNPTLAATSTSDFANGREIAVSGNKLVVADDASMDNNMTNRLVVYTLGGPNLITLEKKHPVNFALWGIHLDGATLYAIQDVSPNLAIFNDFFSIPAGTADPDQVVFVEGIVRTHGLTYDSNSDVMVLTDIGAASSADDGFLVVVPSFSTKISDNVISNSEQLRIGGTNSMLGNPVDVALDTDNEMIFVAERAFNGGMVLGFNYPTMTGNVAPFYSKSFAGASGINIPASLSAPCANVNGGLVELATGGTSTTITIDGNPDVITFTSSVPFSNAYNFTYVVTSSEGLILGIPPGDATDFDPAGVGTCYVYGLTYTGDLNISAGDNLLENGLAISAGCFDLSSNFLTINRIMGQSPVAGTQIFVSSNNSGMIGVIEGDMMDMLDSEGMDADGIFYDKANDILYQANRSDNVVNVYTGVATAIANGTNPTLTATSTSDFSNAREIAVWGNKLVVADDATMANNFTNRLVVYTLGGPDMITLEKKHPVNFALWGIHLDGSTLYAIQDMSPNVAVFNNFFDNADGTVEPDQVVYVEGIVRTHGLTYDSDSDLMILTDIGAASSPTDGFLVVVPNFTNNAGDNFINMNEQFRVGGAGSMLGNPVDVAYDAANNMIYVAERAVNGGMVLGFSMPNMSGNVAPFYSKESMGASGINIPMSTTPMATANLLASSNTTGNAAWVSIFDDGTNATNTFESQGMDADGIYYNASTDMLYQLNRTNNVIDVYGSVKANLMMGNEPEYLSSSSSDFSNGREIAVINGDQLVVAQDANAANDDQNKLVIYNMDNDGVTFQASYNVDINLWGIEGVGSQLMAIVDNSNMVAIFNNLTATVGDDATPDVMMEVENLTRTHGMTYHATLDLLILTDIGAASSPDDGGIVMVENLTAASADGMISANEQIKIEGTNTQLGNPVDVEYDAANEIIYVAERANEGGKILGFAKPISGGNTSPTMVIPFAGVSALYLDGENSSSDNVIFGNDNAQFSIDAATPAITISKLYPIPAISELNVVIEAEQDISSTLRIFSLTGQLVQTQRVEFLEGENKIQLNVNRLSDGMYFIEIPELGQTMRFTKNSF